MIEQQSQNQMGYQAPGGVFDQVHSELGQVKPHWRYLLNSLQDLGEHALSDRQLKAHRILRDDGATYHIYEQEGEPDKTWQLDLVPSLIDSDNWTQIEAGLLERAELMNLLLKDIYGPRNLIRHGVIPPEVIFAHPGFLRPCDGVHLPGEHQLFLHSADLMLDTNGQPCVLADRTQCPSGAGYVLENRTVMSRVLPSLFRDSHVHRLAGFFQRLRAKLTALSPDQEQPHIALLTPGAHNETYFEHAYLANYLGLHLVQSGDLLVRNGFVWMKSLNGLSRVDVIWRRVDDLYCDPVELRGDSLLGVPGLLEVIRAGRVVVVNPLGSGILESPALLKYLPEIGKELLGREPRLATVPTYWCGDPKDRDYVLANLHRLVIKQTFAGHGKSIFGSEQSSQQLQELAEEIRKRPMRYVAQEQLSAPLLPSLIGPELTARPAVLRTYAVAGEGSYTLMPGGLTRVGLEPNTLTIANQLGSRSKDTWVLASEPERIPSQAEQISPAMPQGTLVNLPSRVVENLFWMGRYAVRAEALLRLLRTVFVMLNGDEKLSLRSRSHLLQTVTQLSGMVPGFVGAQPELLEEPLPELLRVTCQGDVPGSVRANIQAMLNCADESKELLSSDMLRVVNDISDAMDELQRVMEERLTAAPEEALDPLVTALLAFSGLVQESMIRGMGWRFLEIGRRAERVLQTSRLIQGLVVPEVPEQEQSVLLQSLLLSQEVLITYRRQFGARLGVQSALDLVLLDMANPRSMLYQLEQLQEQVTSLPKAQENRHELAPEVRAVIDAVSQIKMSVLTQLSGRENGRRQVLEQLLLRIQQLMDSTATLVASKYFDHRQVSQQLVRGVWEEES